MNDEMVNRLRLWAENMHGQKSSVIAVVITEAADEIERLRAERDEAKRGLCYEVAAWVADFKHSTHEAESRAEAERRGWDCFKENTDA